MLKKTTAALVFRSHYSEVTLLCPLQVESEPGERAQVTVRLSPTAEDEAEGKSSHSLSVSHVCRNHLSYTSCFFLLCFVDDHTLSCLSQPAAGQVLLEDC